MTQAEIFTYITAFISMVASSGAMLVVAFVFYRIRDDYVFMQDIKKNLVTFERINEENGYISDQITNVLYDLYSLISSLKANSELIRSGYVVKEEFFDELESQIMLTEKHFAELGLFSRDEVRRRSVQQSLANMFGDMETVDVMQRIADKKIGVYDKNIIDAMRHLKNRLMTRLPYVNSADWTGRPSRGAF